MDGEAGEEEGAGAGAEDELVEHGAEDEEEGVEVVDGGVEGEVLGEGEDGFGGDEEVGFFASGEAEEAMTFFAEAGDDVGGGEGG